MENGAALRLALAVYHVPWRVKLLRSEPLPDGVPLLLRIAAGEGDAELLAAGLADRPPFVVRQAATFFIEQMLLYPEADSYRALGTEPDATTAELRRNMAWLMAWLHPDLGREAERSVFVARVTGAWNDLKTSDRRAAYDLRRQQRQRDAPLHPRKRRTNITRGVAPMLRAGRLRRALAFLFGRRV